MKRDSAWVDVLYLAVATGLLLGHVIEGMQWAMILVPVLTARAAKGPGGSGGSGVVALVVGVGYLLGYGRSA